MDWNTIIIVAIVALVVDNVVVNIAKAVIARGQINDHKSEEEKQDEQNKD